MQQKELDLAICEAQQNLDLIRNLGYSSSERMLEKVNKFVQNSPGVMRSQLMRNFKLNSMDTDNVIRTLEQRGMISTVKQGKALILYPE